MYAGIDLGIKKSGIAIIKGTKAEVFTLENEKIKELVEKAKVVAVDAPTTYGEIWRDCDRAVFWANPLPLSLPFMKELMKEGMKLRKELGEKLIETFTNGIRKVLGVKAEDLGYQTNKKLNKHEKDALLIAFTAFLHRYRATQSYGKECKIWLPIREVGEVLRAVSYTHLTLPTTERV